MSLDADKLDVHLPREYFAAEDVFDRETEQVFARHWICVGHVSEFPEPPSYRVVKIGSYNVILVCSGGSRLRAFHNVCRHRGTQICDQPCGRLANDALVCPYHAWTYNLQGQLIGAPNMADQDGFQRSDYSLFPVQVRDWNGLVMLRLTESSTSFEEEYQPLIERLANWSLSELRLRHTLRYDVRANWKLLFQNYSECYHCPTVHPELNRLTPYRSASNDLTSGPFLGGPMELAAGFETVSRDGRCVAGRMPGLTGQQQSRVYYYTVFPSLFISAHPDYVMVHVLERRQLDRTHVACHFFLRPGDDATDAALSRATSLWDEVNRQDWHVCELTQRGADSPAFRPGPYSQLESMVRAFNQHYLQVMQ